MVARPNKQKSAWNVPRQMEPVMFVTAGQVSDRQNKTSTHASDTITKNVEHANKMLSIGCIYIIVVRTKHIGGPTSRITDGSKHTKSYTQKS